MPGLKASCSTALLLLVVTGTLAAEFTYKEYAKETEGWRRGFVFGVAQHLSAVAQPEEEPPYPVRTAYERCLAGYTDAALARHLDSYVARNPPSAKEPIIRVTLRALFDLCRSEIEKRPSPPFRSTR